MHNAKTNRSVREQHVNATKRTGMPATSIERGRLKALAGLVTVALLMVPLGAAACGHERWAVKTGTDRDAAKIHLQPVIRTRIAKLDALRAPAHLSARRRIRPVETHVYRVRATLIEYKRERDDDYHLVLRGRSGQTMIAEIPAPHCVGSTSPLAAGIAKARHEFNAQYHVTDSFHHVHRRVEVTGVGFFDFHHGQTGVAPNAIELHPVLDVRFAGGG